MTSRESRSFAAAPPRVDEEAATQADADSASWLEGLSGEAAERDATVRRLHALLLRAARWQIQRMRPLLAGMGAAEIDILAQEAADDATVAVLGRQHDYAGRSRFTTWAFKFAILHASVAVRRAAWRQREIPTEPEAWPYHPDPAASPDAEAEAVAVARMLRSAIQTMLTPHQRGVLVALAINDVPVDVLAERLGTTRGALYKTLHDARARLRTALREQGIEPPVTNRKGMQ
jgi:RNA polymerase sigma-70 factor (ECF subfamily)